MNEAVKQVIVVRKDLGMRKGKMVAQGAHASMLFMARKMAMAVSPTIHRKREFWDAGLRLTRPQMEWIEGRFTKVCVSVNSEAELMGVHRNAEEAGLVSHLVLDAGLTEFGGVPTYTCCAIGPDYASKIDGATGNLPLL